MALITAADFDPDSGAEYCQGLDLEPNVVDVTMLTATIARATSRVNEFCNDSFDGEPGKAITLDGSNSPRLVLPKRCTAITTLATLDAYGNSTTQAAGAYRLHPSLVDSGSRRLDRASRDWVEIVPWSGGLAGQPGSPYVFYPATQSVTITGNWGWTTCPADIKRCLALIVFDQCKPVGSQTVRATRWMSGSEVFDINTTSPTGIVEADMILKEYAREQVPYVAVD